jgi:tRNA (guanosine-2'-O-)-methyltransferase
LTPERIARLRRVLDLRQPDLTVVTDFVHKQRNLSAIVRSCDAAGVLELHAVIGDEDYRAFRGTAMGSHQWVDVHRHATIDQALTPLRARGYQVVAAHPAPGAASYRTIDFTRPTALLLGAEKRGVSEAARDRVDHFVTVPMMGMVSSLNVSVAAGIILAEAQAQREGAGLYSRPRIDRATYQRLFFEWGYPSVAAFCRERGLAYPPLTPEGDLHEPSSWYARIRGGNAPVGED